MKDFTIVLMLIAGMFAITAIAICVDKLIPQNSPISCPDGQVVIFQYGQGYCLSGTIAR